MASGLPIVASSVGDIPVALPKHAGILVPPHQPARLADGIEHMLAQPKLARLMGQKAHAHFQQHYAAHSWMHNWMTFYQKVLASKKSLTE